MAAFSGGEESIFLWRCSGWLQTPEDVWVFALEIVQKRGPNAKVGKDWIHSELKRVSVKSVPSWMDCGLNSVSLSFKLATSSISIVGVRTMRRIQIFCSQGFVFRERLRGGG